MAEKFSAAQRQAITATEGFVRVVAGAGSGKTRALTERFAFLVNELGILPEHILCVTFTNKAANEMRQRIHNLIGDEDTGYINTFHGFCVSVLQEDSHAVQYPKNFLVLDNSDIDDLLGIIYEERGLTLRDMTYSMARDMIEIQKLYKRPEYYLDMLTMRLDVLREKYEQATTAEDIIFYGYLYQEKKTFALDYNDLIKFVLYIFSQHADIRMKWQQRLEYIMVDEFQDIDSLQYELMQVLCDYHKNLFIVGDPDQTIYTWRGADVKYIQDFDRHFRPCQTIMMLENYRSTPQILAVANALIAHNQDRIAKALVPTLPDGAPVRMCPAADTEKEAAWLVQEMQALHAQGVAYGQMAVLYRAHFVTRPVEEALLRAQVPYHIYSGVPFFGRAEIKDALSYLRLVVLQDDLSFRRVVNVPKRNIGQRRMAFLEEYAAAHDCTLYQALQQTVEQEIFKGTQAAAFLDLVAQFAAGVEARTTSDLLADLLQASGYERMLRTEGSQERLDNLAELKQSVQDYELSCGEEATPQHYLAHVALFANGDLAERADKVKLMTVHAAKGLEFPYVFLCGMNEGIFPSRKTRDLPGMEEERRLAFVAVTRAQQGLYLSCANGRNFDGAPRYPSRFVLDIGDELLDYTEPLPEGLVKETRQYIARSAARLPQDWAQSLLPVGTRVRHVILGDGTITATDTDKGRYTIQFDELPTPRQLAAKVKLVPLKETEHRD